VDLLATDEVCALRLYSSICMRNERFLKGEKSALMLLFIFNLSSFNCQDGEIIIIKWSGKPETNDLRFCLEYRDSTWTPWEVKDKSFSLAILCMQASTPVSACFNIFLNMCV